MEIIKKQISIDDCRSHKPGLLPFIHSISGTFVTGTSIENNNYGHFVCDLSGSTGVIRYLDIIGRYNEIKTILRTAVYCYSTINKNGDLILRKCNIADMPDMNCEDMCFNKMKPYDYIPCDYNNFIVLDDNTYLNNGSQIIEVGEFYVLLNGYKTYEKHEEWAKTNRLSDFSKSNYFTFIQYVDNKMLNDNNVDNYKLVAPCVELPILLENEYIVDSLYYPYEYSISGDTMEEFKLFDYSGTCVVGENIIGVDFCENKSEEDLKQIEYGIKLLSGITVESKLGLLTHPLAITLAEGYTGIISGWTTVVNNQIVDGGQLFKCIYHEVDSADTPSLINKENTYQVIIKDIIDISENEKKYSWFECIPIGITSDFMCCDGENIIDYTENNKKYKNITLLSQLKYIDINVESDGVCYFLVRYNNGKINPTTTIDSCTEIITLDFPFKVGEKVNIETFNDGTIAYDEVISATLSDSGTFLTIDYVLKATSGESDTGIFYTEKLAYENNAFAEGVWIDGVNEADIYYKKIDYNTNSQSIYNVEYGLYTDVRLANIIKFETHNFDYYEYPLITRDSCEKLLFEPKIKADVIYNRGNAAGWEKHFKLMECNTMRDLENYGNNIFNL